MTHITNLTLHNSPARHPLQTGVRVLTCALLALTAVSATYAQTTATVSQVRFYYENKLAPVNSVNSNSATIFSGNVGAYNIPGTEGTTTATVPHTTLTSNTILLAESGFGAPFAADVPYGNYESDVIKQAQKLLYWEVADSGDQDNAAFRYLRYLYGPDTSTTSLATRSFDQRRDEILQVQAGEAELTSRLQELAAVEIQTKEEFLASFPDNDKLTDKEKAGLDHQRQVLAHHVEYAKNELLKRQATETRKQRGVSGASSIIRCNFQDIGLYYRDKERDRVNEALTILRNALKFAPLSKPLATAYLDVFYDQAVAELQIIKMSKVDRAKYRLGLTAADSKFAIDNEISTLRDKTLPAYEKILKNLSMLLAEHGGVDVSTLDSSYSPGTPLGYYMFKREQPTRNKNTATWLSGSTPVPVPTHDGTPTTSTLFDGYKDYVMLLTVISDYLTDSADLARMYGMRGLKTAQIDDLKAAKDLVSKVQTQSYMDVKLLEGMFSDYNPEPGDASGVYGARQGILTAFGEIEGVRSFLSGKSNALGFDPNFLVLIKEHMDATQGNQFDSYDALVGWITTGSSAVYNVAETTFMAASTEYKNYRATAEELSNETDEIQTALADRYFQIVGTRNLEDPIYNLKNPDIGSELAQSLANLIALNQKKNGLTSATAALNSGVSEATEFVNSIIPAHRDKVSNSFTQYKDTVTPEYDTITKWSATAAGSQAAYDTITDTISIATGGDIFGKAGAVIGAGVVGVAGAINTGIQITAAEKQGDADKNINLAQSDLDANLAQSDVDILAQQSAHELSALRREQIGNAMEAEELLAQVAQERAHYVALFREVEQLKQTAEANLSSLSDRYFADPIHQLRAQSAQLQADSAFKEAQKWVFFTQRALEYKWNKPFAQASAGVNYDSGTIMKARNFTELKGLMNAMYQFNLDNVTGYTREEYIDKLSVKNDFFGLRDDAMYASTLPDGTSITVNATTAFRNRLAGMVESGLLRVPLDTFSLKKVDGTFFIGPEYDDNGKIFSAGKYLDKIDWLKFSIISDAATATPTIIGGNYSYGGTSYIRTRVPSPMSTGNDREIKNEFRQFPFQYYLLDNGKWVPRATQTDTVSISVSKTSPSPSEYRSTNNINTFLKERSVAATQQELSIATWKIDLTKIKDIEIYVHHYSHSREFPTGQ